jgi:ArsR family transcriptional regulator
MPTTRPVRLPPSVVVEDALRALSEPTRVRILHLLRGGALCVGDLVSVLGIPQPNASRHLAYLRRAQLVEGERRGGWSFYRLAPARPGFHQKLLDLLDEAAAELPEARRDEAALRKLQTKGGCCPQHAVKGRK